MGRIRPITTLVAGLGRGGWQEQVKRLAANRCYRITAVCDTLPERCAEAVEQLGCPAFGDVQEALHMGLAELAVISTPTMLHADHAVAALKAGCHVLVDHPAATTVREVDRMIVAARRAKRILTVCHTLFENRPLRFLREVMDSGVLGEVFWIRCRRLDFDRRNDWQSLRQHAGGALNYSGIGHIHLGMELLESPLADAWGVLRHTVAFGDAEDTLLIMMRGKNGRLYEYAQSSGCAVSENSWLVCGTMGSLQILEDVRATIRWFDPREAPGIEASADTPLTRRYDNDDRLPWREKTVIPGTRKHIDFYEELYKSIREGKPLLVTPESVRKATEIAEGIRKSSDWK